MESTAFDQLLRLGDELQEDYGHMFGEAHQKMSFDEVMDGDSLSLLLSDLDAPCSISSSSYSGMASQSSSSSSPAASHASSINSFPYQDLMTDSSPFALESPPPMHPDPVLPMMSAGMHGHYEDYASPSGTYSSSEDSGHHSPTTPSDHHQHPQPLHYDLEAGCYDYGCVQQQQLLLERRSSSEDSGCGGCEFAAPAAPAARRALRLQQASPPAADPAPQLVQQQQQRVVYVLPPQQVRPAETQQRTYKVTPPPAKVVPARPQLQQQQPRQPQQQVVQQVRLAPPAAAPAAAAVAAYQPVVVKQQQRPALHALPKTAVLLARTTPGCVQLVSTSGAPLVPIKVEPKYEVTEEEDIQYFRKQEDRKQKNRAAAQQSRLRRRCELDELRATVSELTERNLALVEDNERLKRRVLELESSHWSPPRKRVAAAGAAATCLMVFVMMFAFQATPIERTMAPFALPIPVSRQISDSAAHSRVIRDTSSEVVAPKTRALLAIEDYDEAAANKESAELAEYAEKLSRARNGTTRHGEGNAAAGEGCGDKSTKRYPNQTETIRLNTELNAWVESHDLVEWASGLQGGRRMFTLSGLGKRRLVPEKEEEQGKRGNATVSPFNSALPRVPLANRTSEGRREGRKQPKKKSPRGEAKMQAEAERAMRDRAWKHLDMVSPGLREHGPENRPDWSTSEQPERMKNHRRLVGGVEEKEREWRESYERLAAAVQQRTDTLYVVAMKDYLLLPAIDRNATARPRISIILPAVMNGTMTTANNQVMLMRLDLDVVGTGLLHLAEGLLPIFNNLSIY